jgi:hypothetical protein
MADEREGRQDEAPAPVAGEGPAAGAESVDGGKAFVSEQERFLALARKVLLGGPVPASLHDAYGQIERAVRGEG